MNSRRQGAISTIADHLRRNAVGYVALFVALGGTGYAALRIPANSVGARQIKNHVITPVKFNPKFVTGSVRAWAVVGSDGRVIAGGGKPAGALTAIPGVFELKWGVRLRRHCATIATIDFWYSPATETISIPGEPAAPFTAGYAVGDSLGDGSGPREQRNHRSHL